MDILLVLLEKAGTIVSKEDLVANVWPDTVVDDAAIRVHISTVRKALGDGIDGSRYIINVPQRGYSFVSSVSTSNEESDYSKEPNSVADDFLPFPLNNLVGREEIVTELADRLRANRCLTIVGAGGIGKTTTALAVANHLAAEYADGVRFIDLAPLAENKFVPLALTTVLGVAAMSADPWPALAATLRNKKMLLIIDNCEHVIDAAAALAEHILKSFSGISLLNTSREPMRIRGESVHHLSTLAVPDPASQPRNGYSVKDALGFGSVQLFVQRCEDAIGNFELRSEDVETVISICQRLDGIPLAIELAAGRVGKFGIRGLASMLDDRLRVLTQGLRTAAPRHRTLRETIDWSYRLLTEQEQRVLETLAIFKGHFTEESAAAICGEDIFECLSELSEKSLLSVTADDGGVYYRLLDVTRAYASERLNVRRDVVSVRRRHANYFLDLMRRVDADWKLMQVATWLAKYRHCLDNVRAAIAWSFSLDGDPALGINLTLSSQVFFCQLSLMDEHQRQLESALSILEGESSSDIFDRLRLLSSLANLQMHTMGVTPRTREMFERAHTLAVQSQDLDLQANTLFGMWFISMHSADYAPMMSYLEQFKTLPGGGNEKTLMHERFLATSLLLVGNFKRCLDLSSKIIEQPSTNARGAYGTALIADRYISMHCNMARCLWMTGFPDQALSVAREVVKLGLEENVASLSLALGYGAIPVAMYLEEYSLARQWTDMLIEHTRRYGLTYWESWGSGYDVLLKNLDHDTDDPTILFSALRWPFQSDLLYTMSDRLIDANLIASSKGDSPTWSAAEILRRAGQKALITGTADTNKTISEFLLPSLQIAKSQGALSWELRTATDLAKLEISAGHRDTAKQILSSTYAQFTEGFSTPDLIRARALLDRLA